MHLKKHVDFVKNVVKLFELLVEYRDLKIESSDELKTFYLNEILVSLIFFKLSFLKLNILCISYSCFINIWSDTISM